jgi:hypothetical protein
MQIGVGIVCQIVPDIQAVFETEDNGFQWTFRTFQKVVTPYFHIRFMLAANTLGHG